MTVLGPPNNAVLFKKLCACLYFPLIFKLISNRTDPKIGQNCHFGNFPKIPRRGYDPEISARNFSKRPLSNKKNPKSIGRREMGATILAYTSFFHIGMV